MRIALAADHNGIAMKSRLVAWLTDQGYEVDDLGSHAGDLGPRGTDLPSHGADLASHGHGLGSRGGGVVDYPALCVAVAGRVTSGACERGIVVGGTGGGEVIACNKIRGIRAGLGHSVFLAEISAAHNDTNVLVLGAKVIGEDEALRIVEVWLTTPFKGGVHQNRLDQIAALER
ncbi:RpiB/LacA/LacB family sugar-phosphate isomerase [Herbidospora sp. RD11066]